MPTQQNGQTHLNNLSENCQQIVWLCLTILWGWHIWRVKIGLLILKGKLEIFFQNFKIDDTRQFVWHWKKIKASSIFSLYIYHLLSKYQKKTMINLKTSKEPSSKFRILKLLFKNFSYRRSSCLLTKQQKFEVKSNSDM